MPENILCESCDAVVLGFTSLGPRPVGSDACPVCGGTEFAFLTE